MTDQVFIQFTDRRKCWSASGLRATFGQFKFEHSPIAFLAESICDFHCHHKHEQAIDLDETWDAVRTGHSLAPEGPMHAIYGTLSMRLSSCQNMALWLTSLLLRRRHLPRITLYEANRGCGNKSWSKSCQLSSMSRSASSLTASCFRRQRLPIPILRFLILGSLFQRD